MYQFYIHSYVYRYFILQFSTVLDQDRFIQVVCDPVEFQQMFNLHNHSLHDSVQLQKDLCEAAASHKLVIQQMLAISHIQ